MHACMMERRIPTPSGRMDLISSYFPLRMEGKLRICCQKIKKFVKEMKVTRFRYALIMERREGEDIPIAIEVS